MEFLGELKDAGIPAAIVTSSDNVKMDFLFKRHPEFKDYFAAIITGSMVEHSKPDPEGYLLGASKIGVAPEDCFVFEDSLQGVEAGARSGAAVIAVATTNSREKLADRLKGKAHKIIDNFAGFNLSQLTIED